MQRENISQEKSALLIPKPDSLYPVLETLSSHGVDYEVLTEVVISVKAPGHILDKLKQFARVHNSCH